jgi:hypothetical protein
MPANLQTCVGKICCLGVIARLNLRLCALLTKLTLPDLTPAGGLTATFQLAWSMIASLPMRLDLE